MRGFIEGLVYVTIIGQVPHLLGISGASGNFFTKVWNVLQHLSDVSAGPLLTGMLCLTAMLLLRYMAPAAYSPNQQSRKSNGLGMTLDIAIGLRTR